MTKEEYRALNKPKSKKVSTGEKFSRQLKKREETLQQKEAVHLDLYAILHSGAYVEISDTCIRLEWQGRTFEFKELKKWQD